MTRPQSTGSRRTSFRYLRKSQAGTPLKIDIVRVYEGAERPERLTREEIGFVTLGGGHYQQDVWMHLHAAEWRHRRKTASDIKKDVRSRDTAADLRQPPVRCRPGLFRRCHPSSGP